MSSFRMDSALGLSTSGLDQPGNPLFSWQRFIIIKGVFKKFGQVIYIGNNVNGVKKVVVSFKDSLVAKRLMGTKQKILHGELEVL